MDDYIVKKWFAWYPVQINQVGDPIEIAWLRYVARWWHPAIGPFGGWIYADLNHWGYKLGRKIVEQEGVKNVYQRKD